MLEGEVILLRATFATSSDGARFTSAQEASSINSTRRHPGALGEASVLLSEETTRIGKITVHSLEYSRGGETLHRHEDQDEVLIIVDQFFEVVARVLNPGDIVYLPAGVRHALRVLGDAAGQALSIHLSRAGQ